MKILTDSMRACREGPADWFTGTVWIDEVVTAGSVESDGGRRQEHAGGRAQCGERASEQRRTVDTAGPDLTLAVRRPALVDRCAGQMHRRPDSREDRRIELPASGIPEDGVAPWCGGPCQPNDWMSCGPQRRDQCRADEP